MTTTTPRFDESDDPSDLALASVTRRLVAVESEIRRLEARRSELYADALDIAAVESPLESSTPTGLGAELAYRAVRAELATALHLSEQSIERRMHRAWELRHCYPRVLEAYASGAVSEQHVQTILEAGAVLGSGEDIDAVFRRAAYEEQVLEYAARTSPNRLRPEARTLAEQFAEVPLDARHEWARRERRVWIAAAPDGMADLFAHLPAAEAFAIKDRLARMGKAVSEGERAGAASSASTVSIGDGVRARTVDEIRADLFSDLLLSGTPEDADSKWPDTGLGAIRAHVQVLVPESVLTGATGVAAVAGVLGEADPIPGFDAIGDPTGPPPALLEGYGPIDTATAGRLGGQAESWEAIRVDRETREVLSVDRYRPSEEMRRLLRARDQHCRFPGCRVPLARCDIDHTVDAALGGATATDNLAHLCRGHHTLKHHTPWQVRQCEGGVLEWTSPTGRLHRERPPSKVRFEPARSLVGQVEVSESAAAAEPQPF